MYCTCQDLTESKTIQERDGNNLRHVWADVEFWENIEGICLNHTDGRKTHWVCRAWLGLDSRAFSPGGTPKGISLNEEILKK